MSIESTTSTSRPTAAVQASNVSWRATIPTSVNPEVGARSAAVVRDKSGDLAAATSTGGMTGKRWGRVGDSPIIGAGTWADKRVAVSCTGTGEEFIRYAVAHDIAARVEYGGATLEQSCTVVLGKNLRPNDGGVIAVGSDGSIALVFNTTGMYRAAANSDKRQCIAIWDEFISSK